MKAENTIMYILTQVAEGKLTVASAMSMIEEQVDLCQHRPQFITIPAPSFYVSNTGAIEPSYALDNKGTDSRQTP